MRRLIVAIVVIALSVCLPLALPGQAQGTQVRVEPAYSMVAVGDDVTVEIEVHDVQDLFGVDIGLSFDPEKLQAQDVTAGEFLAPVFEAQKTLDNRLGEVRYVFALMGPLPPVSGSGVLARVVFRGLEQGQSPVDLNRLLLANDAAEEIPATPSGAVIVVGGGAATTTATATATATATLTPSPTLATPTSSATATGTARPTATATVTPTRTRVPSPTPPRPTLEQLLLQQAAAAMGWSATIDSQPPLYKLTYVIAPGHSVEAQIRRYERLGDAETALEQERLGLVASGWDVDALSFFGNVAYRASRSLQSGFPVAPQHQRRFGFAALFWSVGAYAYDEGSQNLAPDPQDIAEAMYQAGLNLGLFGPRYPRAFLPLMMRAYTAAAGPTPSASVSPTVTATPSPTATLPVSPTATEFQTATITPSATATLTPIPSATPSPTVTEGPPPSPTLTATATTVVTPSPTPLYEQLIVNPSFENDEGWTLQGGFAPGYSVSRAHKGLRSMRLGIAAPYSGDVWSSVVQEVSIPEAVSEAQLSFYYFPVSSPVDSDYMYFTLERPTDHQELERAVWMERKQAWNLWTYDLSAYAGQAVDVRIGVYNDGQGITTVYLDDVELWVAPAN